MLPTSRRRHFLLATLLLPFCATAQGGNGNEEYKPIPVAVPIINIAPDARSSGMGDMGVATHSDVFSQYWNAAKYPFADPQMGIGLSITPWLATLVKDVQINYGAFYFRFDNVQSVSTSIRYFSIGSMEIVNNDGNFITTVNPNEFSVDVAYARRFGYHVSAALTGRYIRSDLTGGFMSSDDSEVISPANTFGFDMAFYYRNNHRGNDYSLGVTITNLGPKVAYIKENAERYFLPTTLRIGGQYTFNIDVDNSIMLGLEVSKLLVPTPPITDSNGQLLGRSTSVGLVESWIQSFYDAPYGWREELSEIMAGGGIEYAYRGLFFTRVGYFHDYKGNRNNLTFGAGIKYNFLGLDISYLHNPFTTNDPLSNTLRISLMFDFNLRYRSSGNANR